MKRVIILAVSALRSMGGFSRRRMLDFTQHKLSREVMDVYGKCPGCKEQSIENNRTQMPTNKFVRNRFESKSYFYWKTVINNF